MITLTAITIFAGGMAICSGALWILEKLLGEEYFVD